MRLPLEQLRSFVNCPVCDAKTKHIRIAVVDEEEERLTLHVSCGRCGVNSFARVSSTGFGAVAVGMLTDLGRSEALGFWHREPIGANEVLDAHRFLKDYHGGVEGLMHHS